MLVEEGLLELSEIEGVDWGSDPMYVDYGKLYEHRYDVLRLAAGRDTGKAAEIAAFSEANKSWLADYALFMALKRRFGMKSWLDWPDEGARMRSPEALEKYRRELRDDVELFVWTQYKFFEQWNALREYVHSLGIEIIGDIPIYVALDSADVWADPKSFCSTSATCPSAWRACRPTTSAPTASSGATRYTTGSA